MSLSPFVSSALCLAVVGLLGGCANVRPPSTEAQAAPASWYAPNLPHQGATQDLARWWGRFNDPLLVELIAHAQRLSPDVASARAQVFAARAALAGAEQLGRPQLDGVLSAGRGFTDPTVPVATTLSAGVQASWALALWGEDGVRVAAAHAREDAASAGWHQARVLVAAEVAQRYFGWRLCGDQLAVARADSGSRQRTADALGTTEKAGLTAPAVAALARASAAESAGRLVQARESCERQLKALVALSGRNEDQLRQDPAATSAWRVPLDGLLEVPAVPADVLRQRPDVYQAQRQWVAAAQDVGLAEAALRPSLRLSGSLMVNHVRAAGVSATVDTWSLGPLTLTLPLLGRERLQASAVAARAQYEAAGSAYAATVRRAVSEVEQVLLGLDALQGQTRAAEAALAGYRQSLAGTEARHGAGLAPLTELEEARRVLLAAETTAVSLRQAWLTAWVQLYVALGGGFEPGTAATEALQPLVVRDAS